MCKQIIPLVATAGLLFTGAAPAALVKVDSGNPFSANDVVTWGGLGSEATPVPNGTSVLSALGKAVATLYSSQDFIRVDQGSMWQGGYVLGDQLLYAWTEPFSVVFTYPVRAASTQIESSPPGATIKVEAFDYDGNSMGSFTETGGGPVTLGALSTTTPIARLEYSLAGGGSVAFNQILVAAPEPGQVAMGAVMLLGAGGYVWRQRRRANC
jgi:hypothetical protein